MVPCNLAVRLSTVRTGSPSLNCPQTLGHSRKTSVRHRAASLSRRARRTTAPLASRQAHSIGSTRAKISGAKQSNIGGTACNLRDFLVAKNAHRNRISFCTRNYHTLRDINYNKLICRIMLSKPTPSPLPASPSESAVLQSPARWCRHNFVS